MWVEQSVVVLGKGAQPSLENQLSLVLFSGAQAAVR